MLIVTINEVPGKKIEALGVVRGSTVQSRNLGHDIMAGFRTLVGGEVTDYAEMLTEARQIATGRMAKNAEELGADAVLVNTAIAVAGNPVEMAIAFKQAVEAGRRAYEAGLGAQYHFAQASSPLTSFLD
jgi:uncharacterized protein YbjQ (UPF0145 family)